MRSSRIQIVFALAATFFLTHCGDEKKAGAPGAGEVQINGVLAEGTALAGQNVVIQDAAGNEVGSTTTNTDGTYSVNVPNSGDLVISGGDKNLSAVVLSSELSTEDSAGRLAASNGRVITRNLNPVGDTIYRRAHGNDFSQRSMSVAEASQARQTFADKALGQGFNINGLLQGEFKAAQADDDTIKPSSLAVMVKTTIDVSKNRGVAGVKQMLDGIADNAQGVPFLEARDAQIELAANYILSGYSASDTNNALGELIDSSTDVAAAIKTAVNVISSVLEGVAGNSSLADKAAVFLAIQGVKGAMHHMVDFILSNGGNLTDDQLATLVTNVANLVEEAIVNAVNNGNATTDADKLSFIQQIASLCGGLLEEESDITTTTYSGSNLDNKKQNITSTSDDAVSIINDGGSTDDIITVAITGTISGLSGTLVLDVNGTAVTITDGSSFDLSKAYTNGDSLSVTVTTQPGGLICTVSNASGSVTGDVTGITVSCAPPTSPGDTLVTVTENDMIGSNATANERFTAVYVDASDNIFVTGYSNNGTGDDMIVFKYDTDLNLDTSWCGDGKFAHDSGSADYGYAITGDASGNIYVAGQFASAMRVWKLKPDCSLDTTGFNSPNGYQTWGTNSQGTGIVLDGTGNIYVSGKAQPSQWDHAFWKISSAGAFVTGFSGDGMQTSPAPESTECCASDVLAVSNIAYNGSSGVLMTQALWDTSGKKANVVARVNTSNGDYDTGFDGNGFIRAAGSNLGTPENWGQTVEMAADGTHVFVGGFMRMTGNVYNWSIHKMNASTGAADTTWGDFTASGIIGYTNSTDGWVAVDFGTGSQDTITSIKEDSNGKVWAAGYFYEPATNRDMYLLRLNSDGSADTSFNSGDTPGYIRFANPHGETTQDDRLYGLALDSSGSGYAVGYAGHSTQGQDGVIIKIAGN